MSSEFLEKLDEVLKKAPENRHSYFQLKYFVIGKEPTTQGQLWQCLREMESRKKSLQAIELEIEEIKDQLELLDIDLELEKLPITSYGFSLQNNDYRIDELEKKKLIAKTRMVERKKTDLKNRIHDLEKQQALIMQETKFLFDLYQRLEKIEDLKPYDDFKSQIEYYNEKLNIEINLKMLLHQPIDIEMINTVLALPDVAPVKVQTLQMLNNVNNMIEKAKKEGNEAIES